MTSPAQGQSSRELDATVAERLFGWRWLTFCHVSFLLPPAQYRYYCPELHPGLGWTEGKTGEPDIDGANLEGIRPVLNFTTDPAADYLVLERVRETWTGMQQRRFREELSKYDPADYTPGLWSRCALASLSPTSPPGGENE